MKLLCLIDSLGSGGAQRQLCMLAVGLKKRGHDVRFLVYHQDDHFLHLLQAASIPCQVLPPCSYVQRTLAIRRIFRQGWQDVVLAFLEAPSLYAELASIPGRRWGLVVGERLADPGMKKGIGPWLRQAHRFADAIVCNSYTNQLMLEKAFPFLSSKLCTVYNTVDLKAFEPASNVQRSEANDETDVFRIVVVASYQAKKNMINVAKALLLLKNKLEISPVVVDWFGGMPSAPAYFRSVEQFVAENQLGGMLRLHSATRDIAKEYSNANAVGLFSFFEGLPNVICEGLACGKPILLSNVCDAGNLVQSGKNGFLCDPASPEDIAEKILCLMSLSDAERRRMGSESRIVAERLFSSTIVLDHYENILKMVVGQMFTAVDCCWPPIVPETAKKTVDCWG
jgi:glycosyltransferase involved in cell wall biosynthesis